MLRIPRYLEYIYACFALWFFMGNPINVLTLGSGGGQIAVGAESNFLLPGISMALYAIAAGILLLHWQSVLGRFASNPQFLLIVLFIALVLASTQWSSYPNFTLRRSILITGATAFALFFSVRFDFIQQLKILAIALSATVLICLAFGLFLPTYGVMSLPPHVGAWRGTHMHKNHLGPQMAFVAIFLVAISSAKIFKGRAQLWLSGIILCAVFLTIASKSTTAVLALLTMGLIFMVCNVLKLNYRYMVTIFSAIMLTAGAATVYLHSNIGTFLGYFGKGTDLSGRTDIWPPIMTMISQKPLLGYGYEGFWRGEGSPAMFVWQVAGWPSPHAHNGFLEILLAIGWVGGLLFLVSFLLTLSTSFKLIRLTKMTCAICPVLVLVFIMLNNITESNLFNSDVWILYLWTCFFPWAVARGVASDEAIEESPKQERALTAGALGSAAYARPMLVS
ncbi:MAG: O-antigen ligase, partial [Cyanobacteria bacterium J06643_4]